MHQHHAIDVVSSGIHDAKNDLFNALARIDNLIAQADRHAAMRSELRETHQLIERSAQRLSELLSTYRVLRRENPVTLLPVYVPDFLTDVLARARATAAAPELATTADGEPQAARAHSPAFELMVDFQELWLFDRELIEDCLINALQNAVRFARSRVRLSAELTNGFLVLRVADDGPGYPPAIPGIDDDNAAHTGLFLARKLAALHHRHDRKGHVAFETSHDLGGAQFAIHLP